MESYGGSLGISLALTISRVELQYMEEVSYTNIRDKLLNSIMACSLLYVYT